MAGEYAVLVKADFWNQALADRVAALRSRAPAADLFLFLDETHGAHGPIPPDVVVPDRVIRGTPADAERLGLPALPAWQVFRYNPDYPLYLSSEALAPYDYVLMADSAVVIRTDVDAMVRAARADRLDLVCDPIAQPPEQWVFTPSLNGVYPPAAHRPSLVYACLLSRPAWRHLYARRLKHAADYADGSFARNRAILPEGRLVAGVIESWPFGEGFVATELGIAGFRIGELSRFGPVDNYDWHPPFLARDVDQSTVRGFIHPVFDDARYIEECLAGFGDAEQWFDPSSKLRRALNRCDPAAVKARLLRAFIETDRPALAERLDGLG